MSGALFYLMGASGSGKDSLLQGCRARLENESHTLTAHRFITRAAGAGGENHIHLTEAEFNQRVKGGLFAMHWTSHNHLYGISKEIDSWLAADFNVLINGSREYLPAALERYSDLVPVMIEVTPDLLRKRLKKRGRETETEIEQRLTRHEQLLHQLPEDTLFVDNNGTLEQGIESLMQIICHKQRSVSGAGG